MFSLKKNPLLVKKIKTQEKEIYLTFDDGPDSDFTPLILDVLAEVKWKATFFVVGFKAVANKKLIKRMIQEGHAVMSHSSDHRLFHYFKGQVHLKNWIEISFEELSQITGQPQKVFRPPAGIVTPPLLRAAQELHVPLVLWSHRFFDSVLALTKSRILASLKHLAPGDIILLHDHQPQTRQKVFISSLKLYLREAQIEGLTGKALSSGLILEETQKNNAEIV